MAEWTPERLAAARDRCAHATLGPWSNPPRDEDGVIWIESLTEGRPVCTLDRREDATWISHARADLPDALAEIERLRAENAELREAQKESLDAYFERNEKARALVDSIRYTKHRDGTWTGFFSAERTGGGLLHGPDMVIRTALDDLRMVLTLNKHLGARLAAAEAVVGTVRYWQREILFDGLTIDRLRRAQLDALAAYDALDATEGAPDA